MPGKRIPPSDRISKEIMGIIQNLEGHSSNQELLEELVQLSMRKLIQELLEKEIQEHIGKAYYEHGDDRAGYRNGQKSAHLKAAEKRIRIEKPQVADSPPEAFTSSLWQHIRRHTEKLEKIAVEMQVRASPPEILRSS